MKFSSQLFQTALFHLQCILVVFLEAVVVLSARREYPRSLGQRQDAPLGVRRVVIIGFAGSPLFMLTCR